MIMMQNDSYHEKRRRCPSRERDAPSDDGGSILGRGNRMADGDVPVGRQHRQEDGASELVDGGRGQVDLAHGHPEDPISLHRSDDEEWNSDQKYFVGEGEHQDVDVGHGLHLRIPQHHVDDERVAA
jgi:hypothetical protein